MYFRSFWKVRFNSSIYQSWPRNQIITENKYLRLNLHIDIISITLRTRAKIFSRNMKNEIFYCKTKQVGPPSWRSMTCSKASNEVILQNICSWRYGLLENRICSYKILRKPSWKIWSVLMVFLSPGKSYVFWRNFGQDLLENLICSYDIFSSWKTVLCSCGILR